MSLPFRFGVLLGLSFGFPAVAELSAQKTEETWKTDFSRSTVPLEKIVSGGPPKDGIRMDAVRGRGPGPLGWRTV